MTFHQRLNSMKMNHALVTSTRVILVSVIKVLLVDPNQIEMSLKIMNTDLEFEDYFNEGEKNDIREMTYSQLNILLLHKISKWIYSTMNPEYSGADSEKHVDEVLDWHKELVTDITRIHSNEELYEGLNEIRVLTGTIMEILLFKKILSQLDYIFLHYRINSILADAANLVNETQ